MSKGTGMNQTLEEEQLRDIFDLFDKDNNETITVAEYGMAARALGLNPTDEEVTKILEEVDLNKSQTLDFAEFKQAWAIQKSKHKNGEKEIANAFKMFDKDGNGYIEAKELKAIVHQMGASKSISDEELAEMIAALDTDKDGKINIEEFSQFICSPLK